MKLKSPGKRTLVRSLMVTGVAIAGATSLALAQTPALADPTATYVSVGSDTVQDFENGWASSLGGNLVASYNATNPVTNQQHEVITPAKAGITTATNQIAGESCSFNRPNGSGDGNTAIRASLAGTPGEPATSIATPIAGEPLSAGGNLPSNLPQTNCIDIARSSSGLGSGNVDTAAGALVYIPFGVDGVTASIGSTATTAATSSVPDGCSNATGAKNPCIATPATNLLSSTGVAPGFTLAQLSAMYANATPETATNGVTYAPFQVGGTIPAGDVAVDLYIPQPGSGTLKFFAQELNFSASSPPAWDFQSIQPDLGPTGTPQTPPQFYTATQGTGGLAANPVSVEEHDGTSVTVDPNGLFPFSIAQFIAQHKGHNPRFHQAQLLSVNGVAPETTAGALNLSFPVQLLREVYNVVAYDRVVNTGDGNFDSVLSSLLVSTSTAPSLLCGQKLLIGSYGFAAITPTALSPAGLGGEVGGHFCGQVDSTNERGFGPTTGF